MYKKIYGVAESILSEGVDDRMKSEVLIFRRSILFVPI